MDDLWARTLMVRDRSSLKGYRVYLLFIYDGIEDFKFGKVRGWLDAKQPCLELVCGFRIFVR